MTSVSAAVALLNRKHKNEHVRCVHDHSTIWVLSCIARCRTTFLGYDDAVHTESSGMCVVLMACHRICILYCISGSVLCRSTCLFSGMVYWQVSWPGVSVWCCSVDRLYSLFLLLTTCADSSWHECHEATPVVMLTDLLVQLGHTSFGNITNLSDLFCIGRSSALLGTITLSTTSLFGCIFHTSWQRPRVLRTRSLSVL